MLVADRLGGPLSADLAMNALEEVLIRCAARETRASHAGLDPRVQRAARFLATRLGEPFRMDAIATHCGLSPSRLSHLFRESMGTTLQRFSEQLKLDSARQLLAQTNLTITEVASAFGYADALYFSRRYRNAFGHAPSDRAAAMRRPHPPPSDAK
jgi:AraC family transcriptional regulator of arabinose operon